MLDQARTPRVAQLTPEIPPATHDTSHMLAAATLTPSAFDELTKVSPVCFNDTAMSTFTALQGWAQLLRPSRRRPLRRPQTPSTDYQLRTRDPTAATADTGTVPIRSFRLPSGAVADTRPLLNASTAMPSIAPPLQPAPRRSARGP